MSYLEIALRTEQSKQAYGAFVVKLFETWDLNQAWQALESEAKRNGSWATAKFALFLDFVSGLTKRF